MHTNAISLAKLPFADIGVPFIPFPDARAVLLAIHPLAFINFSILPLELPHTFGFPIHVIAIIKRTIGKDLEATAILKIIFPISLVEPTRFIIKNSFPVSFIIDDLPKIDEIIPLLDLEERILLEIIFIL